MASNECLTRRKPGAGFSHTVEANGVNMNSLFVTMCQPYSQEVLNVGRLSRDVLLGRTVTKRLVVDQTLLHRKTMMRAGAAKKTSQYFSNSRCPPLCPCHCDLFRAPAIAPPKQNFQQNDKWEWPDLTFPESHMCRVSLCGARVEQSSTRFG